MSMYSLVPICEIQEEILINESAELLWVFVMRSACRVASFNLISLSENHKGLRGTVAEWLELVLELQSRGLKFNYWFKYCIYLINRPGCLLNFWTLRVGANSRWVLIRGWVLIRFSPFSASVVCLFCNKTTNGNKEM